MKVAVFDLDNTLLAGDSDYLWGQFLVELGIVDRAHYERGNERFYADYLVGTLDLAAYMRFVLGPLMDMPAAERDALRSRFVQERVRALIAPQAPALIERHRSQGDRLLITTATNRFITEPIAELLGIEVLLATEPELRDGRFTGAITGVPNFQEGKVIRLREWLAGQSAEAAELTCYSDSHNDLPLLRFADHAVAVDPDQTLRKVAEREGWSIISLR